ncbi:MAG: hypothetical protein CMO34_05355 [Verrucomicrobia bacterium]|nr:hypothetical protein [Verrucomicrobiota bacterium]
MILGVTVCLLILGIFVRSIYLSKFFSCTQIPPFWFLLAFLFKLSCAISLWLLYTYHYSDRTSADIFKYFDDATSIYEQTKNSVGLRWKIILGIHEDSSIQEVISATNYWDKKNIWLYNDNRSLIRLHLIILHLSQGLYHIHTLCFAIVSTIGSMGIFKFLSAKSALPKKMLFVFTFCLPSTVFWSSGPLKESWLTLLMGLLLYSFLYINKNLHFKHLTLFLLAIALCVLFLVKTYILIVLAFCLLSLFLSDRFPKTHPFLIYLGTFSVGVVLTFALQLNPIQILQSTQTEFIALSRSTGVENLLTLPKISYSTDLIVGSAQAMFNVIFGPLYPHAIHPLSLLASIEHIPYFVILLLPIFFFQRLNKQHNNIGYFLVFFCLLVYLIIGFTTPILGALVRYKSPLIPFYLAAVFTFVQIAKMKLIRK